MNTADWWGPTAPGALGLGEEAREAALAMLERRWELIHAHGDKDLKIYFPWETAEGGWYATWMGEPLPGTHREADEGKLYDWLEASLPTGGRM